MKNYIVAVISIIAIIIALFAIFRTPAGINGVEKSNTLEKMRATGKLDVCYIDYPPTIIKDPRTGDLSGHLIDTIESIAKPIDIKLVYHEQTWGNAAAALQAEICDIVPAAFFTQIPRAYSVAFTRPLFYIGDGAVVRKGDTRFSDIMDADKKGIVVTVATGESGDNFVTENFKNAEIHRTDVESGDLLKFITEVSAGRADIAVVDAWSAKNFADAHSDLEAIFIDKPFNLNAVGWAIRQDDVEFMRFLENSLSALEANGKLIEFEQKYDAHWLHEDKSYVIK